MPRASDNRPFTWALLRSWVPEDRLYGQAWEDPDAPRSVGMPGALRCGAGPRTILKEAPGLRIRIRQRGFVMRPVRLD